MKLPVRKDCPTSFYFSDIVVQVHPTRAITTRNGQQMKCRDIILFDGTVPSFSFTL